MRRKIIYNYNQDFSSATSLFVFYVVAVILVNIMKHSTA